MYSKSKYLSLPLIAEIILHIVLWLFYFSVINSVLDEWRIEEKILPKSIPFYLVTLVLMLFYFNTFWLAPRFFNKKKWYLYLLYFGLVLLGIETIILSYFSILSNTKSDFISSFASEFKGHNGLITGPLVGMVVDTFIYSIIYRFIKDWIRKKKLVKQLKIEKTKSELALLKSQINPHFLFNNLNALDTLIDKDPNLAKMYLNKLSKLYRYTINTMKEDLVSLSRELDFADNYMYLMNQRFGMIYKLNKINFSKNLDNYFIPPASIQGLLENVVKHNEGSIKNPLIINVEIRKDIIKVYHKKNKKKKVRNSLGTGLKNIKARYKIFTDNNVEIINDTIFSVSLPQIKISNKNEDS